MANYERRSSGLPMIVKFVEHYHNGVQSHNLSRYAIGYVVRGVKYIYNGDKRHMISKGDVFFLGIGTHYTEEVPDESNTFEQIMFYYQPEDLHRILMYLNLTYGLNIAYKHSCTECRGANAVSMPAWPLLKGFFGNAANYLRGEGFLHDETAENIKMTCATLTEHDLLILISFSGNTQYILDNIVIAKKKHVPLLALTNYMNSPLAQSAECVLKTTADEQKIRLGAMDSTISQFLVIDLLSSMLAARISEQTEKRILQIFETVK